MAITSDRNYATGQPRIDGHRIWVGHIVANVAELGLAQYVEDFSLEGKEPDIREAVKYCMGQDCVGNVHSYCQGCNHNVQYPGEDLWKVAQNVYKREFGAK